MIVDVVKEQKGLLNQVLYSNLASFCFVRSHDVNSANL